MQRKQFKTEFGTIVYWMGRCDGKAPWLVLLPGLTADHQLFAPQIEHFEGKANLLALDPPAHGESRPWSADQAIDRTAAILHDLLAAESIEHPVLIGQSMGGYLSQVFMELYPDAAAGFVSVDSCPLKREYYANWELAALKHTYGMYRCIPWKLLVAWAGGGCATTDQGKRYMKSVMERYTPKEYCRLADQGYRALAEAVESNRTYRIPCPMLALCGEKDAAGSAKHYNKEWVKREGINMVWIPDAGHNSTIDAPDFVNAQIEAFLKSLPE